VDGKKKAEIAKLENKVEENEGKNTMKLDSPSRETINEERKPAVKLNPDGTVCEDCS
jgi:hypothetical protein